MILNLEFDWCLGEIHYQNKMLIYLSFFWYSRLIAWARYETFNQLFLANPTVCWIPNSSVKSAPQANSCTRFVEQNHLALFLLLCDKCILSYMLHKPIENHSVFALFCIVINHVCSYEKYILIISVIYD